VTAAAAVLELTIYLLFLGALWDTFVGVRAAPPREQGVAQGSSWRAFLPWVVLLFTPS